MVASEQQDWSFPPIASVPRPDSHATSVISGEKLKQLYTLMVGLRAHQTSKARGKAKPRFQEACEAAAVIDLRRGDTVAIVPGQHLVLVTQFRASSDRADHQSSVPRWNVLELSGHDRLAVAAGVAFAHRIQQVSNVVVAFATTHEIARAKDSVRFAQRWDLPIIYWEKANNRNRTLKPRPHDLPTIPVDDHDAVALYRVAFEAMEKARRGVGPTLIQCIGNDTGSKKASTRPRADSIAYMEHYLRKRNLWSDAFPVR